MKIAQIAPLWEGVAPGGITGPEMIIGDLTDGLVQREHEVTLFASGDSKTEGHLVPGCDRGLRSLGLLATQYMVYEQAQLSHVFKRAHEFDLIHSHVGYPALQYANFCTTPVVHTLHAAIEPTTEPLYIQHAHQNFVSLSDSHRQKELHLNYQATIHNAIATEHYHFYPEADQPHYLAFIGPMSAERGPHLAIQIAQKTGLPLKMAGTVNQANRPFFEREIFPKIDGLQIQFLGEVTGFSKNDLMGRALATLFPLSWQEPFETTMAESLATGTPVIATEMGSAPEIIDHGKTGFLYQSVDDCIHAIQKVRELDRWACRRQIAIRFNMTHMLNAYEKLYHKLIKTPHHLEMSIAS